MNPRAHRQQLIYGMHVHIWSKEVWWKPRAGSGLRWKPLLLLALTGSGRSRQQAPPKESRRLVNRELKVGPRPLTGSGKRRRPNWMPTWTGSGKGRHPVLRVAKPVVGPESQRPLQYPWGDLCESRFRRGEAAKVNRQVKELASWPDQARTLKLGMMMNGMRFPCQPPREISVNLNSMRQGAVAKKAQTCASPLSMESRC